MLALINSWYLREATEQLSFKLVWSTAILQSEQFVIPTTDEKKENH